jgi:pyruvate formate-lyase activating enzyme-like uncharacterized protein
MLDNIIVEDSDLLAVRPDLNKYFTHDGAINYLTEIEFVKKQIVREIRTREQSLTGLTGDDLQDRIDTVKDLEDNCLHDKIVLQTISLIFLNNNELDLAEEYKNLSATIDLDYTITSDDTEQIDNRPTRLGR